MKYIQAPNGVYQRTVDSSEMIVWDDTHYCRADKLTSEEAAQFGVHPLTLVTPPAWDRLRQGLLEPNPQLLGGQWRQQWGVYALPDADVAANLAASTAAKWDAIKAERERRSDTGGYKVTVDGMDKWFHSDAKSKTQQLSLVVMGASVPAVPWKTLDGSFVTMTQTLAGQIFAAAATMDMALFAAAESHRAAMLASADPAAYVFSGDWPAVYVAS